jgi:HK97 family phage major capsid protein
MKFKTFLESKNITKEQFEAMSAVETAKLQAEYNDVVTAELKSELSKAATKAEVEAVENKITNLGKMVSKDDHDALALVAKNQGLAITKLKEGSMSKEGMSFRQIVKSDLIAQAEKLTAMKDDKNAPSAQITIKAVQAMTFATNTTGQVGRRESEAGIQRDLQRMPILLELVNSSGTNANLFSWVEKTGREGGVAMVAEGTVKPQGDFDLVEFTQKPKKEALIITISKEMLDDVDGMAKEIEDEVYEQIRLFTDEQILTGDGTGNNIVGLDANATAYTAGAFAGTVENANVFDVIRTGINQVELNNDFPNAVLMHPSDATAMELIKDPTTSQYIMPPFVSAGGVSVKGLPIKTSTVVTAGELYVGNFNRFKVKIREDIVLDVGFRGAAGDWEKNFVSFLGEQRFFAFIPANHYGSIVKADITTAKALLETA